MDMNITESKLFYEDGKTNWQIIEEQFPLEGRWVIVNTEKGRKAIARVVVNVGFYLEWELSIGKNKPISYFFEWCDIPR
jgi:hypothetical protein